MTATVWTPPSFKARGAAKAADINSWVRDNLDWLHHPDSGDYFFKHDGTGANYTLASAGGQELDASKFRLTLTTYGGLILAGGCFAISGSVAACATRMDIAVLDSGIFLGQNMFSNTSIEVSGTSIRSVGILRPFVLPAGTYTFTVVWGVGGGTGTISVVYKPYMFVIER